MNFIVDQIAVRVYIILIVGLMLTIGMLFPTTFLRGLADTCKDIEV